MSALGGSRWPPVAAVLVSLALTVGLAASAPSGSAVRLSWLVPAIEAALLIVLVVKHPAVPGERRRLRRVALLLVDDLVRGKRVFGLVVARAVNACT